MLKVKNKYFFYFVFIILVSLVVLSGCGGSKKKGESAAKAAETDAVTEALANYTWNFSREEFIEKHFAGIEFVETDLARAATMIRRGNKNLKIVGDFPKTTVTVERGIWNSTTKETLYEIDVIDLKGWEELLHAVNEDVYLDFSEFAGSLREPIFLDVYGRDEPLFNGYLSAEKLFFYAGGIILPQNYVPEPVSRGSFGGTGQIVSQRIKSSFTVVLNEGFSEIPDGMFTDDDRTLNIYLPKSIKRIGKFAFAGTLIESFIVPASVEEIDEGAFDNCFRLKTLVFEEGSRLRRIGSYAFSSTHPYGRNVNISNDIYLPDSVIEIGDYAFRRQYKLSNINISKNSKLESIGRRAFEKTQLTNIYLPATIKSIGDSAFQEQYIDYKAFSQKRVEDIEAEYAGLSSVTIATPTPPKVDELSFPDNIQNIYVPPESLELYKETWFDFEFTFKDQLKPIK